MKTKISFYREHSAKKIIIIFRNVFYEAKKSCDTILWKMLVLYYNKIIIIFLLYVLDEMNFFYFWNFKFSEIKLFFFKFFNKKKVERLIKKREPYIPCKKNRAEKKIAPSI